MVSAFAVRNSDLASISSEKIRAVLFGMPASCATFEDGRDRSALVGIHECLDAVHQIKVVVGFRHGFFARRAVLVFQRADAALDFIGSINRRRDFGGEERGDRNQC